MILLPSNIVQRVSIAKNDQENENEKACKTDMSNEKKDVTKFDAPKAS